MKYLDHSQNICEGLTQWKFPPLGRHLPTQLQTWITWATALKPINVLMTTGEITKTVTLTTDFHKYSGESNQHVRFGYIPLPIWLHNLGQVSVSINADPINMMHTSQKLAK